MYLPSDAVQVQGEEQCPAAQSSTCQSCFASCMTCPDHYHIIAVLCINTADGGRCLEGPLGAPSALSLCCFAPLLSTLLHPVHHEPVHKGCLKRIGQAWRRTAFYYQMWQHKSREKAQRETFTKAAARTSAWGSFRRINKCELAWLRRGYANAKHRPEQLARALLCTRPVSMAVILDTTHAALT